MLGLYPRLLGPAWFELDEAVRRAHAAGEVVRASGSFRVRHGTPRLVRLLLRLARVPRSAEAAEAQLVVWRRGAAERWCRRFAGVPLISVQREGAAGLLVERVGVVEMRFRLAVVGGGLEYRQVGLALRLGPFRLPLPRWAWLRVAAREEAGGEPDRTRLAVEIRAPTGGLLFAYDGSVRWATGEDAG